MDNQWYIFIIKTYRVFHLFDNLCSLAFLVVTKNKKQDMRNFPSKCNEPVTIVGTVLSTSEYIKNVNKYYRKKPCITFCYRY